VEFLDKLDYAKDERNPPDSPSPWRFKGRMACWRTDRGKNYTDKRSDSHLGHRWVGKNGP